MIAKRSNRAPGSTSSFSRLTQYITRSDDPEKPAPEAVWAENCGVDDPSLAAGIVEATQALNTRSRADKTYHLIVSFAASDQVRLADVREIERRLAGSLGFTEHQRVCALHTDTDNTHLHVAISKIHPETLLAHTPHRDFKSLSREAAAIEMDFGLALTHHAGRPEPTPPGRAADMEAHAGIRSFSTWCRDQLAGAGTPPRDASDWQDLHTRLNALGIRIRPRGGGLILESSTGEHHCKASSVSRELTLRSLTQRFGEFQPPAPHTTGAPEPQPTYVPAPTAGREAASPLWRRYCEERDVAKKARSELFRERRERHKAQRERWFSEGNTIRHNPALTRSGRRIAYQYLAKKRRAWLENARESSREAAEAIRAEHPLPTWSHWLEHQAHAGDATAQRLVEARTRRPASSRPSPLHTDALDTWISSRNRTRTERPQAALLEHRRFDGALAGSGVYRGVRNVDGRLAGLIEKDSIMLVLPLSDRQAQRLRRERAVGDRLRIDRAGRIFDAPELSR